jgi:hypothetical protein
MALVPVICDTCGFSFLAPNIIGGDVGATAQIVFSGDNRVGPCPRCGQTGRIPNGTYSLVDDALTFLQGPDKSVQELKRFANVLQDALRLEKSDEELEETIRRETPKFFPLFTTFRTFLASKEGQGLAQWLAVLLAAVLLVIELQDSDSTESVTPEQVFNHTENTYYITQQVPPRRANSDDREASAQSKKDWPQRSLSLW